MKTALFSDLHANRHAFEACLAHARAQGVQRYALLGDLVGYGGEPAAVVERVMALVREAQAVVVLGNHDAMALDPPAVARLRGEQSAQWTHAQLGPAHLDFLRSLPLTARLDGATLLVHASADRPQQWHYIADNAGAQRSLDAAVAGDEALRYVFSGHVHEQALFYASPTGKLMRFAPQPGVAVPLPAHRRWLAIVGSAGQPRDGDPRAMYAIFEDSPPQVTFHRVPYDTAGAAAAIRAAGLPEFDAARLELGR
jgi:diadenosine tetraphosphatase ApaH/serine/threonine PP2A family protein phosphatase